MTDQLITLSIDNIARTDFEIWAQQVLQTTEGYRFEPTGGIHDGGQDGYVRVLEGAPTHFMQISKQADTRTKIKTTIEDIRKTRTIERLTYVTSQVEAQRDIIEAKWSKEFGVRIVIHDQRWLLIQASLYSQLETSLYGYVRPLIDGLTKAANVKRELNFSDRLSILTYLEAEAKSLPASESFQSLCLDTVIYDYLIGTDVQKDIFKTLSEIESALEKNCANVIMKAPVSVEARLEYLCSKENFPRIRKHPGGKFALPYEVRNQFDESNVALKNCEDIFVGSVAKRVEEERKGKELSLREFIIPAIRFAIVETFRRQAINFVHSFSEISTEPNIDVFSIFEQYFETEGVPIDLLDECKASAANVFRRICYSSTIEEREYLQLLLKYFSVKFVMDGDVAVTEYFSEMAHRLKIYLGTDIIVRCLSEVFISPGSQGMTNALRTLQGSGVKLHITRQVLNEVFSHIHATYLTFKNEYEDWYRWGSVEQGKNSDRILIRAFFYAYCEPLGHTRKPRDWTDFLNQFGSAAWFTEPKRNMDDFGSFLIDKYGFVFIELGELTNKIDGKLADTIAKEILVLRERESTEGRKKLALNDAQMALYINAVRAENNERVTTSLYGYDTWWMTEETRVLKHLKQHGQHDDVVMLPQFLINHYMLDPARLVSKRDAKNDLTPSLFGLRITDRVAPGELKKFLKAVGHLGELDEAAARARIRSAANGLKKGRPSRTQNGHA